MMTHHLSGPLIGNIIIIVVFGLGTIACFIAAIAMLLHPKEKNKDHPKYRVLRDDR
ncbi:hypothetical protein H0A66_05405 [Alcaligenaceae bacterium]|nr:hypothetical protein [Alcaligenaceae bacterium]